MPEPATDRRDAENSLTEQNVKGLEIAIGKQVRGQRKRLNLTVAALAR